MDLDRDLLFSYIEEDNIQRAYFRVQPLLTAYCDVREEAAKRWPDNGCLRIVPDRNEQHTFKDRMRSLGHWCIVDLTGYPADANKIRTNKNYRPDRDESNQFILYSDTVKEVPGHTFFEVLSGRAAEFEALSVQAITPLFYIREGDALYGPVVKAAPMQPAPADAAEGTLFTLPCPDEKIRSLLCIAPATPAQPVPTAALPSSEQPEFTDCPAAPIEAATPIAPAEEESPLPIGKPLTILDQSKNFDETLQGLDQPLSDNANLLCHQPAVHQAAPAVHSASSVHLSGTPLLRSSMRTFVPQPKNKVQEVVSSQWHVARNDPPAVPLPAGAAMRQVVNPVETACKHLRAAWQIPDTQNQIIDFLLSLDGMRARLEPRLADSAGVTCLQRVMQNRLQELEAERLATLFQLDKAKADMESFRQSCLLAKTAQAKAEEAEMTAAREEHEKSIALLKEQINRLVAQRDELAARVDSLRQSDLPAALAKVLADAQMAAPVSGIALRMTSVSGQKASTDEMIRRIDETHKACGLRTVRNESVALLALLATCPRFALTSATPAAAATVARNVAKRMGWGNGFVHQISPDQHPMADVRPADGTPAILLTSLPSYAPQERVTKIMLAHSAAMLTRNAAYETSSWPVYPLPVMPFVPDLPTVPDEAPVSAESLAALAEHMGATDREIDQILRPILACIPPLSGSAGLEMRKFISICAALMDGGLVSACDWGILLWIIPMLDRSVKSVSALKPLLEEYPLSMAPLQT